MAVDIVNPELDLNLDHLTSRMTDRIRFIFGDDSEEMLLWMEEVRFLFTQIEPEHHRSMSSVQTALEFPYQTLVTSASNLTSGTLHSTTKTQSVLTTSSSSPQQFDWRKSKRTNLVVVGPGDGVEPHLFGVNPDPQYWGGAWGYSANGEIVQRNGLVMPYADGTSQQLIFFKFDSKNKYLPKPVDLGIGTTIYLQQRLPGG